MSAWTCRHSDGKADQKIIPPRLRIPCWKGLGADSEEKREPASDIDTGVVDSLKALDPDRPIREADINQRIERAHFGPFADIAVRQSVVRSSPESRHAPLARARAQKYFSNRKIHFCFRRTSRL
jgi:hypothetical protein